MVLFDSPVVSNQYEVFNLRLGHQHPVKGVAVEQRQPAGGFGVDCVDFQQSESRSIDDLFRLLIQWLRLTQALFDSHFPNTRDADEDPIGKFLQNPIGFFLQGTSVSRIPKEYMSVEQVVWHGYL